MTVTYTSQVADCKGFGCFWRLLFRWRGSVYKLVYTDLLAYTVMYFLLSIIYRFALTDEGKKMFERISIYTESFTSFIPLSFVLGFYVSIVVQRWWAQYESLPWPDSLSLYISTSIPGNDNRARMMRRTIVRYANLSFTITLAMISPTIKKRFPTLDHIVDSGLLTINEKKIFDDMSSKTTHPTYWMPLVWAGAVVARARKEGRIKDDFAVKTILDEINRLRGLCGTLLSYDWISIPLVYTQVVTLAVYSFFLATLMGRQFLDTSKHYDKQMLDIVFPVFTYLQFFFYMGWLKVAESLVNPFGEDDDDFEINWLVDRNVQISYLIVDEMHNEHPELIQDIYWDEIFPVELPYTIAAQEFKIQVPQGSTANLEIPIQEQEYMPVVEEESLDDKSESMGNPSVSVLNFKRIGSNLSAMFQNPSSILSKSSIFQKSANVSEKSLHRKSLVRIESGVTTISARRGSGTSATDSEGSPASRRVRNVSNDSPTNEIKPMILHNRRRRATVQSDEGIQFIIKHDVPDKATAGLHDGDVHEVVVGSRKESSEVLFKRKPRTISSSSSVTLGEDEKFPLTEYQSSEGEDFLSPLDKEAISTRKRSIESLETVHEGNGDGTKNKPPQSSFKIRKAIPRGPILRSLSVTEPGGASAKSHPPIHRSSTKPSMSTSDAKESTAMETLSGPRITIWDDFPRSELTRPTLVKVEDEQDLKFIDTDDNVS